MDMISSAATSSLTVIVPSSAAIADPTHAERQIPVTKGPISRINVSITVAPRNTDSWLKRRRARPTWLYRIALNESLSFLQKQHPADSLDNEEGEAGRTLESDPYFDGDEIELLLQKAIATLPDKQRIVFNLRYFEEMKYEHMSRLLDTSEGALKASYHLAVKKIEQFFCEAD